jgi:hypothetical protein
LAVTAFRSHKNWTYKGGTSAALNPIKWAKANASKISIYDWLKDSVLRFYYAAITWNSFTD